MASTNPFDLLDDDAQDQQIRIPVNKDSKPAAKPSKTAANPAATSTSSKLAGDNRGPRKDGPPRSNRPRDSDAPRGPRYDRAPREGDATPRPPGGSRAPRGGRGGRGGRHGGYDRHSGTGIVESENKENRRLGDPASASIEAERDAALIAEEVDTTPAEPAEPEEVVKTLDDYLQEKAAKSLKIALPQARTANAGADESQWKGSKVLEVEETGDFIKMGKDSVAKTRKGKKETRVLITDIDIRFTEPQRDPAPRNAFRGGRGGDRAPRGGRGSNSSRPRGGVSRGASVNVDDQDLFPSLA
ncbi:hypothetical protein BGZ76_011075 [Entomortierella beljakovae]|nr:hypothetical protein BGZ76_011075 [Entomortierella beljakovae]